MKVPDQDMNKYITAYLKATEFLVCWEFYSGGDDQQWEPEYTRCDPYYILLSEDHVAHISVPYEYAILAGFALSARATEYTDCFSAEG